MSRRCRCRVLSRLKVGNVRQREFYVWWRMGWVRVRGGVYCTCYGRKNDGEDGEEDVCSTHFGRSD